MMSPRERITIAIANSDGSGLTPLFTGCLPTVGKEEAAKLDQETTSMQTFFGSDWRSANEKAAEEFSRTATISLVQGMKNAKIGSPASRLDFAHGALIQSLSRTKAYSLSDGLPRLIIYSNLSAYNLPVADIATPQRISRLFSSLRKARLRQLPVRAERLEATAFQSRSQSIRAASPMAAINTQSGCASRKM